MDRTDPYSAYRFSIEIESRGQPEQRTVGGFNEVDGLEFETEVETRRVGGMNDCELQLPGPMRFPARLVLRRGLGDRAFLWDWYQLVTQGQIARRDVNILLRDAQGTKEITWLFKQACPVRWRGPVLRAESSAMAFEALELVHRGLGETTRRSV